MRAEQEHAQLDALVQHAHSAPLVAGNQHLALQLDRATRQVRHVLWHGLGQLGFQHAWAIEHNRILANHEDALIGVGGDLLAGAIANAVQTARQRNAAVGVCLVDLGVKFGDAQALGCLDQDHRLQGVAPAHGFVANVGAFFAIDGVD